MNDEMLLTVCIITYNHEKYIEQAIKSVLMQQTNFNFKIVIADDCSTDSTSRLLKKYKEENKDQIHLLLHDKNVGAAQNFIDLITYPKTKYIAYLEGDDYWIDPLKLQKQVDYLEANDDFSMIFTGAEILINNKNFKAELNSNIETREYSGEEIFENWIVPSASVLFKSQFITDVVKNLNHNGIVYGDIVLFLTLEKFGKIYCFNEKTCVYRRNESGVSILNPMKEKKALAHFKAINSIFEYRYKKIVHANLSKIYLNMATLSLKNKKIIGIIYFINAAFYNFNFVKKYLKNRIVSQ